IRRRVRDERSVNIIASTIVEPCHSNRRREKDAGVNKFTINLIFKSNKFHPYRMELHQDLSNVDIKQRLAFCNWSRRQRENFHRCILFSEECTFKNDGELNTWNCRYWAPRNLHWLRTIDRQRVWKINVWCGIIDDQIIGPISFDDNLDCFRYVDLIERELPILLKNLNLQLRRDMF
ncbi:hypothetical protein EAI_12526, partial [Harpegnathos saltator]